MKPTFIQSKGERRALENALNTDALIDRYRDIAVGMYSWTGLPDDCPSDFIEGAIFDAGSVSAKKVAGMGIVFMNAKPVNIDIYGHPVEWLPGNIPGMNKADRSSKLFEKAKTPVLVIHPTIEKIRPYLTIMEKTMKTLNQNITALSQPIVLAGNLGNELDGLIMKSELASGEVYIPTVKNPGVGVQVLDLKAQDHTQNLISTMRSMDSEILSVMGVSNGSEKSSGVTDVETLSTVQELTMISVKGLEVRQKWCEKINAALGLNLQVSFGDGYSMPGEVIEADEPENETKEVKDDAAE